ncbi:hypothetical protein B0H14DRAFT_3037834, partial [Mycena olivaceomarginata]
MAFLARKVPQGQHNEQNISVNTRIQKLKKQPWLDPDKSHSLAVYSSIKMVANITIIVVVGSRKMDKRLLASHDSAVAAKAKIQLVSGYLPKRRMLNFFDASGTPPRLDEIEWKVASEIKRLGAKNVTISGIIFMCNEKNFDQSFPFQEGTMFLGLKGKSLFEKLTVVPFMATLGSTPPPDWLSKKGTCILDVSEPSVVLPKALFSFAKNEDARRIRPWDIYRKAAQSVRRDGEKAVILLAGHSGHGKSMTINRLIGKELLNVGRGTLGSTTKVIERIQVRNTNKDLSSDITFAFDDTLGLEDNTFEDRELNASLLLRYKVNHFTNIYPNVIVLVAAWESITPDAHNEPAHFTSALGKTIYALYRSNLVDEERANIVVVVTKALSSFHQFDNYKMMKEKRAYWRVEEGRRRGIITDLQRKMFARSSAWEIVFVENGGGKDMTAKFPVLPDGLLSHQNLYYSICNIIKRPSSDGSLDLVGIQALQVLTGAGPLNSLAEARTEVLVASEEIFKLEETTAKPLPPSPRQILEDLASNYLGMTYDNVMGIFGCTNVLEEQNIDLRVVEEQKDFEEIANPSTPHPQSDDPGTDRRRRYYSSDWAFRAAVAAVPRNSQCHILHRARVVVVGQCRLSDDMQQLIGRLPPWSREEQPLYTQFFKNYGTHIITQLALGGTVRAIVNSTNDSRNPNIMIFRDGGASVAAELTMYLEQHFP